MQLTVKLSNSGIYMEKGQESFEKISSLIANSWTFDFLIYMDVVTGGRNCLVHSNKQTLQLIAIALNIYLLKL
jgi:hypothetical protein